MSATRVPLSGENWQRWANRLLTQHYGPTEYQRVPENHRGDAGLEGFSADGHAYQAYGPEEPLETTQRYEKHRDKMTRDITKFINNRHILCGLLGATRIRRWVLFVPRFDSREIVSHAAAKTSEVLAANLPYVVADDFRVTVVDEDDFATERDCLIGYSDNTLGIQVDQATQDQVDDWADNNDALVKVLDRKVVKLPTLKTVRDRRTFRDMLLKWYLEGQDILGTLRSYTTVYEKVIAAKSHRENYLATSSLATSGTPSEVLASALKAYMETAKQEAKTLSDMTIEALAHEAVSD